MCVNDRRSKRLYKPRRDTNMAAVVFAGKIWTLWRHVKTLYNGEFHVAVRLSSNRSQMTSKCGQNNEVAHEPQASVSLMFLPNFDVLCDLLLNRPTAKWNLFVLYSDQKRKKTEIHTCLVPLDCSRICASLVLSATFRLCFVFFSLT